MLLETTEKCMGGPPRLRVLAIISATLGYAVQSIAEAQGYGVVRDYVGHGIGRHMHEDPNVPNYGRPHSGIELEVGMVLAIEPMINMGTRKTRVGRDGWHVTTRDHKLSAHLKKRSPLPKMARWIRPSPALRDPFQKPVKCFVALSRFYCDKPGGIVMLPGFCRYYPLQPAARPVERSAH